MEIVNGYFDYCLSEKCFVASEFDKTAKFLLELGYRTVAINQVIDEGSCEPKKKKKKGESRDVVDIVPPPIEIKKLKDYENLKILNRLTIVFSNQDIIHKIVKSPNYKKYHIIAISPMTNSAFQFTCSNIDADILTYDPENKISYKLNRKLYSQLIDKGYHYEILYAPAIQDSTKRKNMIHVSHLYHAFGKSKNVIISSGATDRILIRGPYDIINLGAIFGLSEELAKNSILHCGRNVFINSVGRRHGKVVMFTENLREEIEEVANNEDEDMDMDQQPVQKKQKQ